MLLVVLEASCSMEWKYQAVGTLPQSNAVGSIFTQNTQSLKYIYHKHTKFQREKTNNLRNDRERQVAPNAPSAPRKGENSIKMAGEQYSVRWTNETL